jgi:uncharacterized OB-fold protein/acyl dehydratase
LALIDRLQEFVGKPYGGPTVGRDPVNVPMIRHLTDALGDRNPVYSDEGFAATSVHGGVVAPATSLQVWTMSGLVPRSDDADNPQNRLMSMVEAEGYVGVVATNCEQTYHRYLRPGDLLTVSSEVESVAGPKKTGLGEGYFITTLQTFRDQSDEIVGEMRFRILKFIPQTPKTEEVSVAAMAPIDSAFFWEGLEAGELRIQRCASCGALRHPPRPMCPVCRSLERDHVVSSGRGTVYSFVVHHKPPVPGRDHPFAVVLVALDEGTRIVGNAVDCDPSDVKIGMDVEVTFEKNEDGRVLPLWRPR